MYSGYTDSVHTGFGSDHTDSDSYKDYMNCLLSSLKEMVKNYAVALTEASNESLYNRYKTTFDNYTLLQREVYEIMFRKGWYSLEKAEVQKISNKFQMLSQEFSDLQ